MQITEISKTGMCGCESGKNVILGAAGGRLNLAMEYRLGAFLGFSLFFNKEKETHVY